LREIILYQFLIAWVALTVSIQMPSPLARWVIRQIGPVLVPRWRLFAPKPGVNDVKVCFRHGIGERWRDLHLPIQRRTFSFLWNPGRRQLKVLLDLTEELKQLTAATESAIQMEMSLSYRALLSRVRVAAREMQWTTVQFAIVEIPNGFSGVSRERIVFSSALHHVSTGAAIVRAS
jgi:hypothetical protein